MHPQFHNYKNNLEYRQGYITVFSQSVENPISKKIFVVRNIQNFFKAKNFVWQKKYQQF